MRWTSATTRPATAIRSAGPKPSQSLPANAIGAAWSCSKPSQPVCAQRSTRHASPAACRKSISTYGLVAAKATTASATPIARRLHRPHAAATSGARRMIPGYFALAASPTASPASSIRPETISASATVTPTVSGTSVTAMRE